MQLPIMGAAGVLLGGEQGKPGDRPIEAWISVNCLHGAVPQQAEMSAKRSVVQLDCGAAQVAAQQLNQLQQCLRRVARGQVQQAIAMSSEAIQMQLEGLGAQSARQALQLRNAGTRLLAEKGQGQ